ncbi:uncharacterized protein L203_102927 [Cryptococcus depauperatus CBS 7841]|uniref:Zf-C3HC-domain-containing protein n=1 Tax=Cryptococcus depauperatus CBS 7841 TaxID=1295531 RepID=A0AAJ8JST0_9TREE
METDPDLRDVFKLLYSDEEWDSSSSDAEQDTVKTRSPTDQEPLYSHSFTRKRLLSAIDALVIDEKEKKQRIWKPSGHLVPSFIPSTQHIPPIPDSREYAPFSTLSLLSRLRTYQPFTYSSQLPSGLSPIKAALRGWINEGRQGLKCSICGEKWGLGGLDDIRDPKIRDQVGKRLEEGLRERHQTDCAWRIRSCPDNLYGQLLHLIHPILTSSFIPLASALTKACPLLSSISINTADILTLDQKDNLLNHFKVSSHAITPGAAIMALFGWYPCYPRSSDSSHYIDLFHDSPSTAMVICRICLRRLGLWSFTSQTKSFNPVESHLIWCPIAPQTCLSIDGKESGQEWWKTCYLLQTEGEQKGQALTRKGQLKGIIRDLNSKFNRINTGSKEFQIESGSTTINT